MDKTIPPYSGPLDDPNERRNRVPFASELVTLRNLRSDNRRDMDNLERRLAKTRTVHEGIQARYDEHLRALESVQSELNASHRIINLLQDQYRMMEVENDRLQGLVHPIRRCPEEILREIFISAVQGDPKHWFDTATRISHVSRRWRMVALEASQLWTRIMVSADCDIEAAAAFIERTLARTRTAPVQITIGDIQGIRRHNVYPAEKFLKVVGLNRFPSIKLLQFPIAFGEVTDQIMSQDWTYSAGPLVKLVIDSVSLLPLFTPTWACGRLLKSFPTAQGLTLANIGRISVEGIGTISSLRRLTLRNVTFMHMHLLVQFISLEELILDNVTFIPTDPSISFSLPSLENLHIIGNNGAWTRLDAPRIKRLDITLEPSDEALEFFNRHPTIQHLDALLSKETFKLVARILPKLKTLDIDGAFEAMWDWEAIGMENPPFPLLERLIIVRSEGEVFTGSELDTLVRRRCHPPSLTRDSELHPIKELVIVEKTNILVNAPWRQSELLAGCTQRVSPGGGFFDEDYDYSTLTITWPE